MNLSVCMIVKNEERTLARVLDSVKRFADEIVIVDTGSSDRSVEIARRYTDNVYAFEWCDDFSKARNYSFSRATGDYLMWLDCDDVIPDKSVIKILDLKKNMVADVYMLRYDIAFDENDNPTFSYFRERIVRKSMNFEWRGFVHEVITPRGKIEYLDIAIEHRKVTKTNPKRNLNLYRKYLKSGYNFSPRERYYYARELYYNGYLTKCEKELVKFIKSNSGAVHDVEGACFILADCYTAKGNIDKALDVLFYSLMKCGGNAETCCRIGEIYYKTKAMGKAEFWYKCALNTNLNMKSGAFVKTEYDVLIPCIWLTCILYSEKRIDEAKHYHLLAKLKAPNHPSVMYNEQFF